MLYQLSYTPKNFQVLVDLEHKLDPRLRGDDRYAVT